MHPFSAEILKRFPEVQPSVSEGDDDLPYVMGWHLVDWLTETQKDKLNQDIMQRVEEFHRWCIDQPQGESAEDDIITIETVSFVEKLFENDLLLPILKRLLTRQQLQNNRAYLMQWVGKDRYEIALHSFDGT